MLGLVVALREALRQIPHADFGPASREVGTAVPETVEQSVEMVPVEVVIAAPDDHVDAESRVEEQFDITVVPLLMAMTVAVSGRVGRGAVTSRVDYGFRPMVMSVVRTTREHQEEAEGKRRDS
jgi:hypothetical protein